ncbi:MAG: hypothetical protein GEV11_20015 [Streptosporangiales bacterium]|nr:hypothetical protein [Streptosporangiales bacterium]
MADNHDHGNTPAAWTTVVLIIAGFCVGGLGMVLSTYKITWTIVGLGIVVAGAIAGKVMQLMGLGRPGYGEGAAGG